MITDRPTPDNPASPPPQPERLLYTVPEAARLLSYSERRVYEWIADGTLPAVRLSEVSGYRLPATALRRLVSRLEYEARARAARRTRGVR
jgi:excisionase family DNA binding protein